jgi:hypothetical protein
MNASKTQLLLTANAGTYQLGEPGRRNSNGLGRPGNGDGRPGNGGGQPSNGGGQPGKEGDRLGKGDDHVTIMVDGKEVKAGSFIELLGVSFDRKLTTRSHAKAMLVATKQRPAVISRLVNHILRGAYLWQLATGLVNGKLCHALAAYASPRLPTQIGEATPPTTLYHQIQVAYNRVARSITGVKIRDRVAIQDLLERAGLPSVN